MKNEKRRMKNAEVLEGLGCEILRLPSQNGRPDVGALLEELGRRRMTNVLVEGGAALLGSFLDAGAIDEVHVFIAPRLIGGVEAKGPIGGLGVATLAEALTFSEWASERVGENLLLHGWRRMKNEEPRTENRE
jgi:diaminohydroxyphosphoribosylaminopyrimidine deaminase/5-amino-6-(5-phosphoribosylamino)uracil reductase